MKKQEVIEIASTSRRNFFKQVGSVAAVSAGSVLLGGCLTSDNETGDSVGELDRPRTNQISGRYVGPVTLFFEPVAAGVEIRYSLDRFDPEQSDALYDPSVGITLTKSTTVCARAYHGNDKSELAIYSYLVKKDEQPLFSMIATADVHTSDLYSSRRFDTWISNFDVMKALMPEPDLMILAGDHINDNDWTTGADHALVNQILSYNISRIGWKDLQVSLSRGNHDAYLDDMKRAYPHDWFPAQTDDDQGAYFYQNVNGAHVLVYDSNYDYEPQEVFLREKLADIKQDPSYNGEPIIVHAHHPLPGLVNGGGYSSGRQGIKAILEEHPEVIHFSGHSHFPLTREDSIFQEKFTSLNCSSIDYVWHDGTSAINDEDTIVTEKVYPVYSMLFTEIYHDRVEIERVAMAADPKYWRVDGVGFKPEPDYTDSELSPLSFHSAGALCGETWIYPHGNGNVDLAEYNQERLDSIKSGPMDFDHQAALALIDNKLRMQFNHIRGEMPAMRFLVKLFEISVNGHEEELFNHNVEAGSIFTPIPKRLDYPIIDVSELRFNREYRMTVSPGDAAMGLHEEDGFTCLFNLEGLENGDYVII